MAHSFLLEMLKIQLTNIPSNILLEMLKISVLDYRDDPYPPSKQYFAGLSLEI